MREPGGTPPGRGRGVPHPACRVADAERGGVRTTPLVPDRQNVMEMADERRFWPRATAGPPVHAIEAPIAGAPPRRRHPSQITVLLIGIVYVAVGVAGLLIDQGRPGVPQRVLGFQLGLVHDLVRANIGLLGLAMWAELRTARSFGKLLSIGYGISVVVGLLAGGQVGIPPLHGPDGLIHLGNAAAAHWPKGSQRISQCACGQAVQAGTLRESCTMAGCSGSGGR
jgi:hypothetical protein